MTSRGARAQWTVIAPHADDAALSLAGTLELLAGAGASITLVTCHTRSAWAPAARRANGDVEAVTRLRADEDAAYARHLGARLVRLDFAEAPLRLPERAVQGKPAPADRAHGRTLARALSPLVAPLTLIPLAVGDHVDHTIVRAAAAAACRRQPLGFYEDVPYTLWSGWPGVIEQVRAAERLIARRLHPVRLEGFSPQARRQAAAFYPSQFSSAERRWIDRGMTARGGEVLWTTRRMCAALCRLGTRV
jgi:LmbE family N-acetylglucosaminyl deacetylase